MPSPVRPELDVLCPECGEPLIDLVETEGEPRFACGQGHAFSGRSLIARQGDALESALWDTVRQLEARATLLAGLAGRARAAGAAAPAERFEEQARETMVRVRFVRRSVLAFAVEEMADQDAAPTGERERT